MRIYQNISTVASIAVVSLSISAGACAAAISDREQESPCSLYAERIGAPQPTSDAEIEVARAKLEYALCLIAQKSDPAKGMQMLEALSEAGEEDAKYRLGWIYMQNEVVAKDNDRAFSYLIQVKSDSLALSASILIAAIYAEGSKYIPKDRSVSQKMFDAAAANLNEQGENSKCRNLQPSRT